MVVADERAVSGSREKSRVNQSAEHGIAGLLVQPPESPRLLRRQAQTRHFEKLPSNAAQHFLNPLRVLSHQHTVTVECDLSKGIHTKCQPSDH